MRLRILSDLHFEHWYDDGQSFIDAQDPTDVDVLILAGDIYPVVRKDWDYVMSQFCTKFRNVVFVAGNHEFYGASVPFVLDKIAGVARHIRNLHWLENRSVEIDGQRFIGSTLWFEPRYDGRDRYFREGLSDFTCIKEFDPWVYRRCTDSKLFLATEICAGDVVVTHHLPHHECVSPRWRPHNDGFGRFFLTPVDTEALLRARLVVNGHTHDTRHFKLGVTEFVCNPCGYPRENTGHGPEFDPGLTVTI